MLANNKGSIFSPNLAKTMNQPCVIKRSLLALALLIFVSSCLSSRYDSFSYQQSTSLKVDALSLIDKATTPYASHKDEVDALLLKANKAYEYEKHRPKNAETTGQWKILLDPKENLLTGFLKKWKTDGTESATFSGEQKKQLEEAFDKIIKLESHKIKGN